MCALAAALATLALASAPAGAEPRDVQWIVGPATVELADAGVRCAVPVGVALAPGAAARSILSVVAWGADGSELAVFSPVEPTRRWFVVLGRRATRTPEGAGPPGADRREGALVWIERPRLDEKTGRTSWALAGPGTDGPSVNRHAWIPMGTGAVEATLVASVEELSEARAHFARIVDGIEATQGATYRK